MGELVMVKAGILQDPANCFFAVFLQSLDVLPNTMYEHGFWFYSFALNAVFSVITVLRSAFAWLPLGSILLSSKCLLNWLMF